MNKKYVLVSLEDSKTKKIAEVLSSKTCKKILEVLAENDSSEKEISDKLKLPINTVEYNLRKLLDSGMIEKKDFVWSKKGKKIDIYKISNKSIIISPKNSIASKLKSVVPAVLITSLGAIFIKYYYSTKQVVQETEDFAIRSSIKLAESQNYFTTPQPFPTWGWFLAGGLFALLIITLYNWRKL